MTLPKTPEEIAKTREALATLHIPSQPTILLELLKIIGSESADLSQVAALVKQDPALTARLFFLMKSPLYGIQEIGTNIHQALAILGLRPFYRLILSAALRDSIDQKGTIADPDYFWHRTLLVARIGETLALAAKRSDLAEQAYLIGLFHDCGTAVLARTYDYGEFYQEALGASPTIVQQEFNKLHVDHAIVAYLLAKSWKLPESVRLVVGAHHDKKPPTRFDTITRKLFLLFQTAKHLVDCPSSDYLVTWTQQNENNFLVEAGIPPEQAMTIKEQMTS